MPQGASKSAPWLRQTPFCLHAKTTSSHTSRAPHGSDKIVFLVEIRGDSLRPTDHSVGRAGAQRICSRSNQTFFLKPSVLCAFSSFTIRLWRSLEDSSFSLFWKRSRIAQRDFLRTLRRAITHCISTHRRSTGTLCYLAHSSHTVSVVLKFNPFYITDRAVGHCGAKTTSKALFFQT